MAGLPNNVIERANEILNGFEQENMFGVRSQPVTNPNKPAKQKESEIGDKNGDQLTFMDSSIAKTIPNVFKEIKGIEVNHTTPVEALKLIEKWKKKLEGK
jgi:DNA mismatch repair ATPase MutS